MKMDIDGDEIPASAHASELLSNPGTMQFQQVNRLPEQADEAGADVNASDFSSVRQGRQFSHQYAHTYFIRLSTLRPTLEKRIRAAWKDVSLKKISGLCESSTTASGESSGSPRKVHNSPRKYSLTSPKKSASSGTTSSAQEEQHGQHIALREDVTVAIIGTVFKQQPDKPSILQELVEEIQLQDRTKKESYVSDKDVILLEDETTRVRLIPTSNCGITVNGLVNGIVLGVKGRPTIDGRFEVEEVMWATPSPCKWPKLKGSGADMVIVSGLGVGSDSNSIQLGLLFEHLQGLCGSPYEQQNVLRNRSRLFILGNSLAIEETLAGSERFKVMARNMKTLDDMLSTLAATMEVFLVTGKDDPAESMYPQPPLNKLLFPKSTQYPSFHLLSNPCRLNIPQNPLTPSNVSSRLDLILTDGEPVLDALKFSDVTSGLEMGRRFLEWGHICPTAPDTLPLSPGVEEDVFIIKEKLPNFFLIGNQKEFKSQQWNGTKIVSVPRFSDSRTAVVIASKDFEPHQLQFNLFC